MYLFLPGGCGEKSQVEVMFDFQGKKQLDISAHTSTPTPVLTDQHSTTLAHNLP
jgi:hypothetical protein